MNKPKFLSWLTPFEWGLLAASLLLPLLAFAAFDREHYHMLAASLIGAVYLILNAKGNPMGQVLAVLFSLLYGYISYTFAYYGEMITYLGMTAPMAVFSLIAWLRHPFAGKRAEVQVNRIGLREVLLMLVLTAAVAAAFYWILGALHTANLLPSTLSVATSFAAAYLTMRRSRWFTLAYAANDVVLIVLWSLAAAEDRSYLSVLVCFVMFLVNDLYGFFSWTRIQARQRIQTEEEGTMHKF